MTYEAFKQLVFEEIEDVSDFLEHQIKSIITMAEPTIVGCYDREMSAEDTVSLILKGQI